MEQKREFTGIWIPREIIEDETLTKSEMIIYAEIACFTECRKSNEALGLRWKLKKNTVSIIISSLIKKGFITSNNKTGEYRNLYANQRGSIIKIKEALSEKSKSLCDKNHTREYIEKTKEINTLQPDGCEVFSSDEYINILSNSPKKHLQLIGWYFREKNLVFPNKKSAQAELLRWVRDASLLIEYPEKKIIETKNLVQEKFPFDWKLSTIVKYINETKSDEKILLECIEEAQAVMGLDGDWDVRARRNYLEKKGIPFENHWVNPEWTKWLKKYPYLKTT